MLMVGEQDPWGGLLSGLRSFERAYTLPLVARLDDIEMLNALVFE